VRPASVIAIAAVAALSAVGAAWAVATRPAPPAAAAPGTAPALFPALAARANDVAEIRVRQGGDAATLVRFGDRWVHAEKGGFPADMDRIRAVVAALAGIGLAEPRTDRPDRLARLSLEDPAAPGSRSRLVELRDSGGTTLARLVVGRDAAAPVSPGRAAAYVRRPEETRAWLADRAVPLPDAPIGWVDRRLADFAGETVRAVSLRDPDGREIGLARTSPRGSFLWAQPGLPAPRPAVAQRLSVLLADLSFDDVRPAGEVDFSAPRVVDVHTFDGLRVRFEAAPADGAVWVRMSAALSPVRSGAVPAAAVGAVAAALGQRADGWAFRLADWRTEAIAAELGALAGAEPPPQRGGSPAGPGPFLLPR
jgi:hypothetical protein